MPALIVSVPRLRLLLAMLCALALAFALVPPPGATAAQPPVLEPAGDDRPALRRDDPGAAAGEQPWPTADTVPGALIVTTADAAAAARVAGSGPAAQGLATASAERVAERVTRVEVTAGQEAVAAAALRRQPGVVAVEPEHTYQWAAVPDDARYGQQWPHAQSGIERAWNHSTGSANLKIAILDSGVDARHPDLSANVVAQANASSALPPDAGTSGVPRDNAHCPRGTLGHSHGTSVAGVAGAVGDNGGGVAGVAWRAAIVDVALTGTSRAACQGPSDSAVVRALDWVARRHPDTAAVNLSFGTPQQTCPASLQQAIDDVRRNGTVVVAAAGNSDSYTRFMPAGCDGVIAVGATGSDGSLASYSNKQHYVDLSAPGGELGAPGMVTTGLHPDSGAHTYVSVRGTSFAAPYVAGVAALIQDARADAGRPRITPGQVERVLEVTARHPDGAGAHDEAYGWGVLHAGDAVGVARGTNNIGSPATHPLLRWARDDGRTEPITQAIAISQNLFEAQEARHVLIARADDYADALAGSSLGYGVGPILFNPSDGRLDRRVENELRRVLAPGPALNRVYVLGGTAALDPAVDARLAALGYRVTRLDGATREHTARRVAAEVGARLSQLGVERNSAAILATRGNWPDAVAAGSLGAAYGVPVVLTPVGSLHPATERALAELAPTALYVIGGTAAISDPTLVAAARASGADYVARLGGAARDETAVAVAEELEWQLAASDVPTAFGIAVNLDRGDGYAPTLAASAAAAVTGSVFVPVRQAASGVRVTEPAAAYSCALVASVLLPGAEDLLPQPIGVALQGLLESPPSRC